MHSYKNIKIKLLLLVVVLLAIFSLVTFYYEKNSIQNEINAKHKILHSNVENTFNILLEDLKNDIQVKLNNMFKLNKNMAKSFALKNRKELYQYVKPLYDNLKVNNKYLKIMTFRLVDGTTFLRVHKPKMYGDKLSKSRKIIIDTNNFKENQYGFEIGKLKMTYRIVMPIFYKNEHIGLVEVGIEPEFIMEKINKIYGLKSALVVKNYKNKILNSKYIIEKDYYLIRGDKLFKEQSEKIIFNIKHNHIIYKEREYHIDSKLNLNDHKNNVAAKILIAYDTTENIKAFDKRLEENILRNIFLVLILLVVLNFIFNYFIDKIIFEAKKNLENEKILTEQAKLVSMGEMIGNIAHQWRQPLSVISTGATGLIRQKEYGILDEETLVKCCTNINDNAQYLSKTIDDFKNFIKGDKKEVEFVLKDTIDSFINLVKGSITNNNINIQLNLEDGLKIHGYPNELIQCLINIFNNSKDAIVENSIKEGLFLIEIFKKDDEVIILTRDNAKGIPSNVIDKIFEPYFTTKHQSKGTGLGLHMTYNLIVEGMNGTISVKNTNFKYKNHDNIGAEFMIALKIGNKK
ncbi:MAG TPA: hypothetical protein EYG73_06130 [Arcobacter sp.]|nr:hypothetical protein [Arcobacter sp.]